jgi:hypothetical protein
MSHSVHLIVEGYVRLKDRDALHDILAHRQDLLRQLVSVTGVDPSQAIAQVNEEITIIEAGLTTPERAVPGIATGFTGQCTAALASPSPSG